MTMSSRKRPAAFFAPLPSRKKSKTHCSDPSALAFENPSACPLSLTFRDAWAARAVRAAAVWLDVPVDADSFLASALGEFVSQYGAGARDDDTVVGLQIEPRGPLVCLVARNWQSDDCAAAVADACMLTAMSMRELFTGTDRQWSDRVVELVSADVVLLELRLRPQEVNPPSRPKAKAKVTAARWRLCIGIDWHRYEERCSSTSCFHSRTTASLRESMREVMLWALMNSQDLVGQWTFPYPKELGVLYRSVVSSGGGVESDSVAKFDAGEIHSRIDARRLLRHEHVTEEAYAEFELSIASDRRLRPTLRQYQKAALLWMLNRERPGSKPPVSASIVSCVAFERKADVQYDPFQARFFPAERAKFPLISHDARRMKFTPSRVCGGILADEMGLGKTVEVIALILRHPRARSAARKPTKHAPMDPASRASLEDPVKSCICGTSVEDLLGWVQCDYCGSLHHQLCTGYNKSRSEFVFTLPGASRKKNRMPCDLFMCFVCEATKRPKFKSKATLIVSPETIRAQWESEFERHVESGVLMVLVYPGVKAIRSRFASQRARKPSADWQVLATAYYMSAVDVVLTTYEVLGSDLRHLPSESGTERRSSTRQTAKRYPFIASPLVYSTFWRVCMDEAQVGVENTHLSLAMTVAQLQAVNKWVVTGTPFSTSITDLYGTLKFLRVQPFASDEVGLEFFETIITKCFAGGAVERVLDMLLWDGQGDVNGDRRTSGGGLLWRIAKADVLDQLDVPEQHNDVVWCHFSRIERHFYETQAARVLAQVRSDAENEMKELDDALWRELLQLRQLCCHPVVSSKLARAHVRTVDDLLADMLHNARVAYKNDRRNYVRSQNNLAAIYAISEDCSRAIALYLDAFDMLHEDLSMIHQPEELLQLHVAMNLAELVRKMTRQSVETSKTTRLVHGDLSNRQLRTPAADAPKLNSTRLAVADKSWTSPANHRSLHLDAITLESYAAGIRAALASNAASDSKKALTKMYEGFAHTDTFFPDAGQTPVNPAPPVNQPASWWKEVLLAVERCGSAKSFGFADGVRASLSATSKPWSIQFANSFQSVDGLRRAIADEWGTLANQRRGVKNALLSFCETAPTEARMLEWRSCNRCRYDYFMKSRSSCGACALELRLEQFYSRLTGQPPLDSSEQGRYVSKRVDFTAPLALLEVFEAIVAGGQQLGLLTADRRREVMASEESKWTATKDDLSSAKALLDAQRQRFKVLHQVSIAVKRFSLDEDPAHRHPALTLKSYIHLRHLKRVTVDDVNNSRALDAALRVARSSLDGCRGKWHFIQALDAQRREEKRQQRPRREDCAVCWQPMKPERIMLPCAHSFCHSCVYNVVGTGAASGCGGRCPMCRIRFYMEDVTLVCPDRETLKQDVHVEYGCKVDAIVDRVLALAKGEPRVKCLLFSQWESMLLMTTSVLVERGVRCFRFISKKELPGTLNAFKTYAGDAPSVLALPYRHGSTGLNIMEATHVLLAEPPLNEAIEKQAVSRVYRIGQTRETVVHRFVVRDSVEERIYRARHASPQQGASSRRSSDYKTGVKEKNGEERISVDEVRALLMPSMVDDEEEKTEEGRMTARSLWAGRVAVSA